MTDKIINVIEIQWEDNHRGLSIDTLHSITGQATEGKYDGEVMRIVPNGDSGYYAVKGHWKYTVMIEEDKLPDPKPTHVEPDHISF